MVAFLTIWVSFSIEIFIFIDIEQLTSSHSTLALGASASAPPRPSSRKTSQNAINYGFTADDFFSAGFDVDKSAGTPLSHSVSVSQRAYPPSRDLSLKQQCATTSASQTVHQELESVRLLRSNGLQDEILLGKLGSLDLEVLRSLTAQQLAAEGITGDEQQTVLRIIKQI